MAGCHPFASSPALSGRPGPVNIDVPVRYLPADQGGVSHFHYVRDNLLLTWMNLRLLCGLLGRLPARMRARPIFLAREAPAGNVLKLPQE